MAYIVPSDVARGHPDNPELDTLERLKRELPPEYTVFHSLHWTRSGAQNTAYGESDFIVLNESGEVLVIEQKNGGLEETTQGLEKNYPGKIQNIPNQIRRSIEFLRSKFGQQHGRDDGLNLDYLFYCPDYAVKNLNAAGLDTNRIVDARTSKPLTTVIQEFLPPGPPKNPAWAERVEGFFRQTFDLVPDVHAHKTAGDKAFIRLSGGLAEVLSNIEMSPLRLRVYGAPGCGKTAVALKFYERALQAGKRPLLVCFNRPLMEKLKASTSKGGMVQTWHGLCAKLLEATGEKLNYEQMFSDPSFWDKIQERVVGANIPEEFLFDFIIVDEGQDFKADWYDLLGLFKKEGADILWLEDQDQSIRKEAEVELEGFVGYREASNYRSPASISRFIQRVLPFEFVSKNDLPGMGVSLKTYKWESEQVKAIGQMVAEFMKEGFSADDITILTLRGINNSVLSEKERLGNHTLRRFIGEYDLLGNQVLSKGQIRFESIYRFKGQQAPAIIIADAERGDREEEEFQKLLYTAMTRATVRLGVVALGKDHFTSNMMEASYV